MKLKNSVFLLLIAMAGSAQAISFRDYYYGNWELDIPSHEKEVNACVISLRYLSLRNKDLTDLIGFHEIPGLNRLRQLRLDDNQLTLSADTFQGLPTLEDLNLAHNQLTALPPNIFNDLTALQWLYLSDNQLAELPENIFSALTALKGLNLGNNQLTALPANIFRALTALQRVDLYNNPIPLTEEQLCKELHLSKDVLNFKVAAEEEIELELFVAMRNADVSATRQLLDDIRFGKNVTTVLANRIAVSKIRDANGDNLLHAAIRDAAERIKIIDGMSAGLPEAEKKAVKEVQAEQKTEINDRYMKIISIILSCHEEYVQDMLFTTNAEGQQVIDAVIAKLGFDSPITQTIFSVLISEGSTNPPASARPIQRILCPFEEQGPFRAMGGLRERKIRMEEAEKEAMHPRPKRALEQAAPVTSAEPMVDVEAIEKEQKEVEGRKRQKPNQPEEQ